MRGSGMAVITIYATEELKRKLTKAFGEGRISSNVERILRHHLQDSVEEKKMRLAELNQAVALFNHDFNMAGHLIFEEEIPPRPPKELTEEEVRAQTSE